MLEINNLTVVFNENTVNEHVALDDITLKLDDGDFVTVIGSNGAGKSTLLNAIAGNIKVTDGTIVCNNREIQSLSEHKRACFIGRLYQDPLKGTAPHMTIEENLALANSRGKHLSIFQGVRKKDKQYYQQLCNSLHLDLDKRMNTPMGLLSGGQRQALTLLMATIQLPEILLLDEHTAALDPKTSIKVMNLTNQIITENKLTTIMVTHNIESALFYGNKTIVMDSGKILRILSQEEKKKMTVTDVMKLYPEHHSLSDSMILS